MNIDTPTEGQGAEKLASSGNNLEGDTVTRESETVVTAARMSLLAGSAGDGT